MSNASVAEEQGVAGQRPGWSGTNDREPFQTHVPFRSREQLADKDQAAVRILGFRSRLFHLHDKATPEGAVAIGAPQFARARPPGGLEIAAPDQAMRPHVEDIGEV